MGRTVAVKDMVILFNEIEILPVKDMIILFNKIEILPEEHFVLGVVDGISTAATIPYPFNQTGSLDVWYGHLTRRD